MRIALLAALLVTTTMPALAAAGPPACILEASANLPRIPGIAIVGKPTTRPAPGALVVDVRVRAAGMTETLTYLCMSDGVLTLVQRVAR
jgi:hypothetical protein